MVIGLLILGIAALITAVAAFLALQKARKDADCNFGDGKVGAPKQECPAGTAGNPLSENDADSLFKELASRKDIPFDYPRDCCCSRAHEMCRTIESKGIQCRKHWLFDENWGTKKVRSSLAPKDKSKAGEALKFPGVLGTREPVTWVYHVAPVVRVRRQDGTVEPMVFDPSLADKPLTKKAWRDLQSNPSGAYAEESDSQAYFQNSKMKYREEDPTGEKTSKKFEEHGEKRDELLELEERINEAR